MPEIAEIHRYAKLINDSCKGLVFNRVVNSNDAPSKYTSFLISSPCTISASARGKELCLSLFSVSTCTTNNFCWNHGLVGKWIFSKASDIPRYAHIQFHGDHDSVLSYVDTQKMGSWKPGGFSKNRGPDPITEHKEFCSKIIRSLSKSQFSHPICVVMLNQDYFNGIGNYLRAEILHRACVDPTVTACDLFRSCSSSIFNFDFDEITEDSDKGLIVLYLCKAVPEEVLEKGLNKYGNAKELEAFTEWLRIYGKGEAKVISGRAIHYAKTLPTKPDLPVRNQSKKSQKTPNLCGSDDGAKSDTHLFVGEGGGIGSLEEYKWSPFETTSGKEKGVTLLVGSLQPHVQPLEMEKHISKSSGSHPSPPTPSSLFPSQGELPPLNRDLEEILKNYSSSSPMVSLLLLVSYVYRNSYISLEEREKLKMHVISENDKIFEAQRSFVETHDLKNFVETCKRHCAEEDLCAIYQNWKRHREIIQIQGKQLKPSQPQQQQPPQRLQERQRQLLPPSLLPPSLQPRREQQPPQRLQERQRQLLPPSLLPPSLQPRREQQTPFFFPHNPFNNNISLAIAPPMGNKIIDSLQEPGWRKLLEPEFSKPYFRQILKFVENSRKTCTVYPKDEEVLNAFSFTPLDKVKVVILGQDPYFGPGQAHGLAFSVQKGTPVPPSLKRIYHVLERDISGFQAPNHGCLEEWARQGVLLLNATLYLFYFTTSSSQPPPPYRCYHSDHCLKLNAILV
eukprot:TRINITY_DN1392_c0_g2_i7.p1 TRINITY_DN1392_c0_g2~~TRINITY_DN1392_c0_g2_i7.p1  ORF type:complete len:733 (-),score=135.97 TRINITY_DN1392_c0_g2_i7:397-2595(-)